MYSTINIYVSFLFSLSEFRVGVLFVSACLVSAAAFGLDPTATRTDSCRTSTAVAWEDGEFPRDLCLFFLFSVFWLSFLAAMMPINLDEPIVPTAGERLRLSSGRGDGGGSK